MSSKAFAKKKDAGKSNVFQSPRSTEDDDEKNEDDDIDDEIKAELEAMTNLEYNLHSDFDANDCTPEAPLFSVKKSRNTNLKEFIKHDKPAMTDKSLKAEKFDNESHIQTYVPNASIEELEMLIRQAASSCEDRYKILDARDRLMRAKQVKSQYLSMTKVTCGICPDMCPEKERMMRESQRQVAPYELLLETTDYRINHEIAVKQYSRSSADQEEPMPQDLRPVKSLRMTMSYLLHEIADLCEQSGTNLAEWYHFLWDRTRSIRKDITQQELCCPDSVQLVQQCARFHIVCAERLCAEQASVFDKKINTENLTKCLQTLKYMYHDLRVKGIICKNEAEFRAYIILLNLNNGNFMWDIQRLDPSVSKSTEVKFAIDVYSCIESNNYAKFFRLVRDTTYLNACILLRYFEQVRTNALSIMVKAYCRTTSTAFPLYELIDILGFEDENEAVFFCEQVGLNLSNDELHIMLNRRNFSQPMTNIEQGRACNYIEFKRISMGRSIGHCIAGEEMPEKLYKGHRPHDSFDSQGYLKVESINAEDQNTEREKNVESKIVIDPYEYTDEQDIQKPATEVKKVVKVFETRNTDKTLFRAPHIFKMPTTSVQSNVFGGTFVKRQSEASTTEKKTDNLSELSSNATFVKSSNRNKITEDLTPLTIQKKSSNSSLPVAPLKRSREEDDESPFRSGPSSTTWVFGNAPCPSSIFVKSSTDLQKQKPFGETNTQPMSTSIFGKPPRGNIFGIATVKKPEIENPDLECEGEETPMELESELMMQLEKEKWLQHIDRETNEFYTKLEIEIIDDLCKTIVKEEIDRVVLCENLSEKIVEEILNEYVEEYCEEILDREIYVQRKIDELQKRTIDRTILKYYGIWREFTTRKRQQRGALDESPVWLQKQTVEECAKSLYRKNQQLAIGNIRNKRLKFSNDDETRYHHELEYLEPIETKIYEGIRENGRILEIDLPRNLYWKMVISWPPLENRPILSRHKKIMNQYICPSDYSRVPIVKSYKPNSYESVDMCIQNIEGLVTTSDSHPMIGTDGLFFVVASTENHHDIVERLTCTIFSRQKLQPIPVTVVVLCEANVSSRLIKLNEQLDGLLESGHVSEYTIQYEEIVDENVILKLIQNATLWLTVNKSPPVPLEMDYFKRIVDTCLTEELWLRIHGHSSFNEHLEKALHDVKFVIDLHNEAVAHLIDIVLDPESLLYTDFPPEFKIFLAKDVELPCSYEYFDSTWKKDEARSQLEAIMKNLLVPRWTFDWPIDDTMELEKCLVHYCQQTLGESNSNVVLCNILSDGFHGNVGLASKTNFVQVLLEILKEKIRHLEPQATIVYNKNHIRHFRNLPWWFKSSTLTSFNERASRWCDTSFVPNVPIIIDETFEEFRDKRKNEIDQVVKNYNEYHQLPVASRRETEKRTSEIREIAERLEKTLMEQKSRTQLLEEKLSLALGESEKNSIS